MRLTLVFLSVATAITCLASESPSNWNLFLPHQFGDCLLSPDGRFVSITRTVPYDPKKDIGGAIKSDYIDRVYIFDTVSGNMVLAGPPDDPSKGQDYKSDVIGQRWSFTNRLVMETQNMLYEIDPASGAPTNERRIHGAIADNRIASLPNRFEDPVLVTESNWSRGYTSLIRSWQPASNTVRRFENPPTLKDLIVRRFVHSDRNAFTVHTLSKGNYKGHTFELLPGPTLETYPFEVEPEWSLITYISPHNLLQDNEILFARYLETGDFIAEVKLFDFRKNQFKPGSLLVERALVDSIDLFFEPSVVDAFRNATTPTKLSEIADPKSIAFLAQLRSSYPLCSIYAPRFNTHPQKKLIRVSSIQLQPAWYLWDKETGKLQKIISENPNAAETDRGTVAFAPIESEEERGGRYVVRLSSPTAEASPLPQAELIVHVSSEPQFDFDWSYSTSTEYFTSEGYHTLTVMIPWKLQLALARASSETEYRDALERTKNFLSNATQSALSHSQFSNDSFAKCHTVLSGNTATLLPALPDLANLPQGRTILTNPRLIINRPNASFSQLLLAASYPFDEFFEPKTWTRFSSQYNSLPLSDVTVVWRENEYEQLNASEQIDEIRKFCESRNIAFTLNRFSKGNYRILSSWKNLASREIGIVDALKGRDSGFDRIKRNY